MASEATKPDETKATPGNKSPLDVKEDAAPNNVVSLNDTQKDQENQAKKEVEQTGPDVKNQTAQDKEPPGNKAPPLLYSPLSTHITDEESYLFPLFTHHRLSSADTF